ncbi:heterokaryon incompatibility protein-domain-containing protein [Phaeosphaeria sp. MPI-PUGE-AT-0046c]|nr:heterokaryon incompatibility protein-domain-containing protein [Phaeosphaeria sp. MPI-PUGE-AT-0046c]
MLSGESDSYAQGPMANVISPVLGSSSLAEGALQVDNDKEEPSAISPRAKRLRKAQDSTNVPLYRANLESGATYEYQPLNHEDSIRLLEIWPGPDGSPLICDIVEMQRTEVRYDALSYVWGPPIFTHKIFERTSRCYVPITKNLFCALSSLRKHAETSLQQPYHSMTVWVDAVCIDQANIDERNHQVKIMASIFSKASKVLVWLGSEECGSAFTTLEQIARGRKDLDDAHTRTTSSSWDNEDFGPEDLVKNDVLRIELNVADATHTFRAMLQKCDIVDLGNLFANPWFTRVWILQEFLLASTIDICMGPTGFISYDSFISALHELKTHERLLPRVPTSHWPRNTSTHTLFRYEHNYLRNFETVDDMCQARTMRHAHLHNRPSSYLRRQLIAAPPIRTLYQWCRMLVDRKCADERDKVYAALGLAYDDLGIVPNYSLTVADVLLELTKRSLEAGDFSVLHDAGTPMLGSDQGLHPSFVPSLRPESRQHRPRPLGGFDEPRYEAGRSRMSCIQSLESSSIRIRGVKVASVHYLNNFAEDIKDLTTGRGLGLKPQLLAAYNRITSDLNAYYGHVDFPNDYFKLSFWQTVNVGFVPTRADLPAYKKGLDFQFLDLPYRQNIAECTKHRAFFMTEQGFIGLAPEWAQAGDEIVIFDGAETPFLLRPKSTGTGEQAWILVGDCYLDHWMLGDYCGCTIVSESNSGGPAQSTTYPKGYTYPDHEIKETPLQAQFFTLY